MFRRVRCQSPLIQLPVICMKNIAKMHFDEDRITFRNGMGKGHITKAKGPKREASLIVDDIDLDIVRQPLLFQLAPNESSGERCRVKRYIKISSKKIGRASCRERVCQYV